MIRPNIVTFFNSPNCGAFLQAFALGDALARMTGVSPRYVDTGARSVRKSNIDILKNVIKCRDFNLIEFERKKVDAFNRALADFEIVSSFNFGDKDLLVFGSDEIWNLSRNDVSSFPALWGSGISGGAARISYAPSSNGADYEKVSCSVDFSNSLKSFYSISCRDSVTAQSVEKLIKNKVEIVCDPTLLLDSEDYRNIAEPSNESDYLLVYSYGNKMTPSEISEIKAFAKSRGLKLISAGFSLPWCDCSVPAGPFEFLGLMDSASFVVTDTFHGTVFASIFHKQFASYARQNTKVNEYMRSYCLLNHAVGESKDLTSCLEQSDTFSDFDNCWIKMRERSQVYLQKAIDFCESNICDGLKAPQISIAKGTSLNRMTTFKMGGKVARMWEPIRGNNLAVLPRPRGIYRVISGGSNLLVSERTFIDVISMKKYDDTIQDLGGGKFKIGASVRIQKLISFLNENGYGGIEPLVSVPGMLGGLICMNASVPSASTCISDYLESVDVFDGERTFAMNKANCKFGYRSSIFQSGKFLILGATFRFPKQDLSISREAVNNRLSKCRQNQDNSAPNFGSVFSDCSLKAMTFIRKRGLSNGDITFSKKTNNWLLNNGGNFHEVCSVLDRAIFINKLFAKQAKLEVRIWR